MSRRHEQLLFHYSSALERGDFEAVAEVLREAEHDPLLEQAIAEINEVYAGEQAVSPAPLPRTQRPTLVGWSLAAALALIAALVLLLARGNHLLSAETTDASALQPGAACSTGGPSLPIIFYSRPSADAVILYQGYGTSAMASDLLVEDSTRVGDQMWYFVHSIRYGQAQGWITGEQYDELQACAHQPSATSSELTSTPTITANPTLLTLVTVVATGIPSGGIDTIQRMPTCTVRTQGATDILVDPSADAKLIEIVPAGTQIVINAPVQEADGLWYWVSAPTWLGDQVGGFILPRAVTLPGDCPYAILESAATAEATAAP